MQAHVLLSYPLGMDLELEVEVRLTEQVRFGSNPEEPYTKETEHTQTVYRGRGIAHLPNGESIEVIKEVDTEEQVWQKVGFWKESKKLNLLEKLWRRLVIASHYDLRPLHMIEDKPCWSN